MERQEKPKRIIVDIDKDTFYNFKSKVISKQKTLKEVLIEFVKQYIKEK
jgi:hypothetical protein